MATVLSVGTKINSPSSTAGGVEDYSLDVPAAGKYVVEVGGTANVLLGVWGPFPEGVKPQPIPPYGRLRVCGMNRWGVRTLQPGTYFVRATQHTAGLYTVLVRNWQFTDYLYAPFYQSTC